MEALYEYKENLPSLDSTLELNQAYDAEFGTNKDSSRDIDFNELAQSLEQKLNGIQCSNHTKKPFTELNNTKQVNNRLDTIEENEQNESDCINKNSKFSYIPSFNKYTCEVSQSPKTSCISSVNTSRYKKSFYNDKTKIGNSKLKQPSAQPRHKITSKSIDVGSSTQTCDTKTKEKQNSTKLRLPTPTKNCKFILNCKNKEKKYTPRLNKSCYVDPRSKMLKSGV